MTEPKRGREQERWPARIQWSPGGPALLLSFVGGMVDSVGYLNLGHLFIGFMLIALEITGKRSTATPARR